jgi:glutamine amidotransferase
MLSRVGVIDHGVGNYVAILNLLRKIGISAERISTVEQFESLASQNTRIVLPGVGSFDAGMKALTSSGLDRSLKVFGSEGGHILGICLGMQLLFNESEEGLAEGLGLIGGKLIRMKSNSNFRVPHVGWETIQPKKVDPLFFGIKKFSFYHNHSFAAPADNLSQLATIDYLETYAVVVRKMNVVGVQFHPEKSHSSGERLISNFIGI